MFQEKKRTWLGPRNWKGMDRGLISVHLQCGLPCYKKHSHVKSSLVDRSQQDYLLWKYGDLDLDEAGTLKLTEFANVLLC